MRLARSFILLTILGCVGMASAPNARAQVSSSQAELIARRNAVEEESFDSFSQRTEMVPMRDGQRIQADMSSPSP